MCKNKQQAVDYLVSQGMDINSAEAEYIRIRNCSNSAATARAVITGDMSMVQNSNVLRANMLLAGMTEPEYKNSAHHIVAAKAMADSYAMKVLRKAGIDCNDSVNGVFFPRVRGDVNVANEALHIGSHKGTYYSGVEVYFVKKFPELDTIVKNDPRVIQALDNLRQELLSRKRQLN